MKAAVYKRLYKYPELDKLLNECFSITGDANEADIVVTDNIDVLKENKLNIIISDNVPENHVAIPTNHTPEAMLDYVKLIVKTYSISPRIDKISFLQEQNALLSEANKGLVELYNLIDNKNHQIEFLKNKLENIINSAGESIVELSEDYIITYANMKFSDTTGYAHDKTAGINFLSMIHPDDLEKFKETISLVHTEKTSNVQVRLKVENGAYITINAYMTEIKNSVPHYEIIFEDISKKLLIEQHMKKLEEKAIVAGFSRHLSHNILNALTVAAGFLRKIRSETSLNEQQEQKWNVIEHKCRLIEEIVTGYNDYTNAISMRLEDTVDIAEFISDTAKELADKTFSKNFSAFLFYFTDQYTLTTEFNHKKGYEIHASKMFLKMALCYMLKDSIRYFDEYAPLNFKLRTESVNGRFCVILRLYGVDVSSAILETMLQPWNHQVLSQSFDYWGIVITNVIVEKHGGIMSLRKDSEGISFVIEF
ncbi:MAG: PAS domain S-box protein [Deferribacterales bacterium]